MILDASSIKNVVMKEILHAKKVCLMKSFI